MSEKGFLALALAARRSWNSDEVSRLSQFHVPDRILGDRRKGILRSDINILWATWFIESLIDPYRYVADKTYPDLFSDVFNEIKARFSYLTKNEASELSKDISSEMWGRISILRQNSERTPFPKDLKFELLADAGESPRCWMCGHLFSADTVKAFESGKKNNSPPYGFVDIYKPLGLHSVDFSIQVDHVEPWVHGGENIIGNLKLSCAWCNRNKSSHRSIYDVPGTAITARPNSYDIYSLPQQFWTVRLIAAIRKCEYPEGCECTVDNSELTVEPINVNGVATPTNLRVVCPTHHFLKEKRLLPRKIVLDIWGKNDGDFF